MGDGRRDRAHLEVLRSLVHTVEGNYDAQAPSSTSFTLLLGSWHEWACFTLNSCYDLLTPEGMGLTGHGLQSCNHKADK